jgi:hypothetical protein
VVEIVDIMKSCNITGDSQMAAMARSLEDTFLCVSAEALREDDYLRHETKQKVDAVLRALPSLQL